jgi:ferritin-like metal-binding protein YciE
MQPGSNANADNTALRDKLIEYLHDMYAVENHLVDTLQGHADDAADFPVVQAKIQQHLEETKQHRQRIEDCLSRYGKQPGGGKNALTGMIGKLQGVFSGARKDTLARNSRDDYVAENFEIVSYGMLIATAQALGDQQTVQACQQTLRDEVNMAKWLEAHTAEVALTVLVQDGIDIPTGTITQIQQQENQQMMQLWQQAEQMAQQDRTPIFVNSSVGGATYQSGMTNTGATTSGTSGRPDSISTNPTAAMPGATPATSGDTGSYLGSSANRGEFGTPADQSPTYSAGGTNQPSTTNPPSLNPNTDVNDNEPNIQP